MPKKSHAKSSPVRKDFFYYLPLITAIVVNLFWGMFGLPLAFFIFYTSAVGSIYYSKSALIYIILLPLLALPLFPISLFILIKAYKAKTLAKYAVPLSVFYLFSLPVAIFLSNIYLPDGFFDFHAIGITYFSLANLLWALSLLLSAAYIGRRVLASLKN